MATRNTLLFFASLATTMLTGCIGGVEMNPSAKEVEKTYAAKADSAIAAHNRLVNTDSTAEQKHADFLKASTNYEDVMRDEPVIDDHRPSAQRLVKEFKIQL